MNYNGVILSGLPGSGKSTVIKFLSEYFSWQVYSIGEEWRSIWKSRHPNEEISFEEFFRNTSDKENVEINKRARKIFEKGNVIGDSRFSSLYCRDLPLLSVFITADLGTRANYRNT